MNSYPMLQIDLDKSQANAAAVSGICARHGIFVSGVVKGVCGSPEVARAMLAGGVSGIADSRISNLERLRDDGLNCELMLLRIPMPSQVRDLVRLCDVSLNSELKVVEAIGVEASKLGRVHKVVLMIDLGDLREGVMPSDAMYVAGRIEEIAGVKLEGVGANLTCYGGVIPSEGNMGVLADVAQSIEKRIGRSLDIVSGGNSSSLPLVMAGRMPKRINHLRVGEGILLGQDTVKCDAIPGTVRDAFKFVAEVIEAERKPSVPIGEMVRDAFGGKPSFEDRGVRKRAILGAGRQDVMIQGLKPLREGAKTLGASSDHLLMDVEDCQECVKTGDLMAFGLEYGALLGAMTSSYVHKEFVHVTAPSTVDKIRLIKAPVSVGGGMAGPELGPEAMSAAGLETSIASLGYIIEPQVKDFPVSSFDPSASLKEKLRKVVEINKSVSEAVREGVEGGRFPLLIGGDHSVAAGALDGLRRGGRRNLGLIVFSAFADFNVKEESPTGNPNGMTLSICSGMEPMQGLLGVGQERIVVIGLRSVDAAERERLKKARVKLFTMERIDMLGMRETMAQAIEALRACSDGVHVSLSMDAISQEYAPGTSLPCEGGLSYREAHLAMEMLFRSKLPVSMDVAELNPPADVDGKTAKLAVGLICSLLGKRTV